MVFPVPFSVLFTSLIIMNKYVICFQNITLSLYDDGLPKLTEYLTLIVVSVIPGDGLFGSTPTSGASIDPATSNLSLTIQPRNYPYGLLQFSLDSLPPRPNDTRILPAVVKIQVEYSWTFKFLEIIIQ